MKKYLISIFCIILLGSFLPYIATGGDQDHPEIQDDIDDTDLPNLDIESAWFYEKNDEPEYLYTSLKIKELNPHANAVLTIRWSYNGKEYVSGLDTHKNRPDIFRSGDPQRATNRQWKAMPECTGIIDQETNIITWKIPKENIGNPEKGDMLTETRAAAVPGFPESFIYFILGRDYRDFAPSEQGVYGSSYTIQY